MRSTIKMQRKNMEILSLLQQENIIVNMKHSDM